MQFKTQCLHAYIPVTAVLMDDTVNQSKEPWKVPGRLPRTTQSSLTPVKSLSYLRKRENKISFYQRGTLGNEVFLMYQDTENIWYYNVY